MLKKQIASCKPFVHRRIKQIEFYLEKLEISLACIAGDKSDPSLACCPNKKALVRKDNHYLLTQGSVRESTDWMQSQQCVSADITEYSRNTIADCDPAVISKVKLWTCWLWIALGFSSNLNKQTSFSQFGQLFRNLVDAFIQRNLQKGFYYEYNLILGDEVRG